MVTYLGGSILITIFALGGSIVSYNLQISFLLKYPAACGGDFFYSPFGGENLHLPDGKALACLMRHDAIAS